MALLFWTKDRPPTPREYPVVLLRAALSGAMIGPAFSLTTALLSMRLPSPAEFPKFLLYSAYVGAAFTLSFFVCCGLPWGYLRPMLSNYPCRARWWITALVGALGSMLAFSIAVGLAGLIPDLHLAGRQYFGRILVAEAVVGAALALIIGSFKGLQRQIRNAEATLHEKEMREHALSEAAARAQSLALQAQINPHFFFNTLNTLSALIPIDPAAAQDMIGRLAEMFRYTLACSRDGQVTLTQELAFIENYLCLEKARFSDRLRILLPAGEYGDIYLPGLSLQPLVENAIRHGISKRIEGGEVQVSVHRNGVRCEVAVANPADPFTPTANFFQDGHALAIVRERLALHSGSVRVETGEPGQVRVSLLVPVGAKP